MVSVILSVYNAERYIERCIKSLVCQTYSDIEIIIINDGSTDDSAAVCDAWALKDRRIMVVHQKNAGVSAARNKGILSASGQYVVFVDSDDWLEERFVEKLINYHKNGELTLTGYYIDYEQGDKKRCVERKYSKPEVCYLGREGIVSLFSAGLFSPVWNKLYDREKLVSRGIQFRKDMDLGEDIVFNLAYIKALEGKICIVNDPLYHYIRQGNESLGFRYHENYPKMQKTIYTEFLDCFDGISDDAAVRERLLILYFNALVTAMDNLYGNRGKIEKIRYLSKMKERREDPEFLILLEQMKGKWKIVYNIRFFLISHGFYVLDFYLRKAAKKMLRLE